MWEVRIWDSKLLNKRQLKYYCVETTYTLTKDCLKGIAIVIGTYALFSELDPKCSRFLYQFLLDTDFQVYYFFSKVFLTTTNYYIYFKQI